MEEKNTFFDCDTLEIHYLFGEGDGTHTLDAFTRNACEKNFLEIIRILSVELGCRVEIETEPTKEGSLIDVYHFIVSNEVVGWTSLLIAIFSWIFPRKTKNEKDNDKLDLILKVEQLKEKGIKIPIDIERRLNKIYQSNKIKKQKSNFFTNLRKAKKVNSLEVSAIDSKSEKKETFAKVPRSDFNDYILSSDKLDSDFDDEAVIEIISPVLKKGKYSWKGIYRKENQVHEFSMLDKDFKNEVVDKSISFQNGTELLCELEICKKLNEEGDIIKSKYKILKVFEQRIGSSTTEMPSGRKKRQKNEADKQQLSLF